MLKAVLTTSEGVITMVSAEESLFLRLFTPAVGVNPQHAIAPYPTGGLSFLDGVPPIGNKFHDVSQLGLESRPNVAVGDYHRTLFFPSTHDDEQSRLSGRRAIGIIVTSASGRMSTESTRS